MRASGAHKRQRIVEVAYALFCKKGFVAASVYAVAEAAGITKRTGVFTRPRSETCSGVNSD